MVEKLFTCENLSINSLIEEIQPVISKKNELEYQEGSYVTETLGIFGRSDFWCKERNWIHY